MLKCLCINNDDNEDQTLLTSINSYNKEVDDIHKINSIKDELKNEQSIIIFDTNKIIDNSVYFIGKEFHNKVVYIKNARRDVFLNRDNFKHVRVLFLIDCHEEFLYNNLSKIIFPALYRLYTNIKPVTFDILNRFQNNAGYICYLEQKHYDEFYNEWWDEDIQYIQPILRKDIDLEMKVYTDKILIR